MSLHTRIDMAFEAHFCGMATRDMNMSMMDMNFIISPLPLIRVHLLLESIGNGVYVYHDGQWRYGT